MKKLLRPKPAFGEPSLSRLAAQPIRDEMRYTREKEHLLHVSDLFALCMRKVYLLWREGLHEYRMIDGMTQVLFDVGEAVEEKMRLRLANQGTISPEKVYFHNVELGIVGNADGRMKNGKLIEFKAKNPFHFKLTKMRPLPKDQFQVEAYLWMDPSQEAILFTYTWDKSLARDQMVRYNLKTGDVITRTVSELREAEAGGAAPRRICRSREDKAALLCPVAEYCFAEPSEGITQTIGEQLSKESA